MTEYPIRDLHSGKSVPPLFCMAQVDKNIVKLIRKEKGKDDVILVMEDLDYQLDIAKSIEQNKRNYHNKS